MDKCFSFDTNYSIRQKKPISKSLFLRAQSIPSSTDSRESGQKHVLDFLMASNYPNDFLKNFLKPVIPLRTNTENENSIIGSAIAPYIRGIAEPIKTISRLKYFFYVKAAVCS